LGSTSSLEFIALNADSWCSYQSQIATIEETVYEPARRDELITLERIVCHAKSASVIALDGVKLVGFCIGSPLEEFSNVTGANTDANWGKQNTLYSADTAIHPDYHGRGIARQLKVRQLDRARELGFAFLSGRNREGLADAMWHINKTLGATVDQRLENDYNDDIQPNVCIYYKIDLMK